MHRPPQCYQRGQLLDEAGIDNQLQLPAFRDLHAPLVGETLSALGLPNSVWRFEGATAGKCNYTLPPGATVVLPAGDMLVETVWLVATLPNSFEFSSS